jgi:NitT/TauT family transport system permease protein
MMQTLLPETATAPAAADQDLLALERRAAKIRRRKFLILLAQVGVLVSSLAAWQIFAGIPGEEPFVLIDKYFVSEPSEVLTALTDWINQGILLSSIMSTANVTLLGLALGVISGMLVGFALGVNPTLSAILNPFVSALYSIPRLALIPLFLLWFGLGLGTRLAIVIVMVFFLVFYNTYSGVKDVQRELIDVMKLMGATKWQIYQKVIIQSAMTWIVAGLRIAAPYALVGAVTAEMLTSNQGMGFLVIRSAGQFYTPGVFAGIAVMMGMALVLTALVTVFEKRILHWKPKAEDQQRI